MLSGAASARRPSGNSSNSRPGTCRLWAATELERRRELIAAKMKRDIHLTLSACRSAVKRATTIAHWIRLHFGPLEMDHPTKQKLLPIRLAPDARPAVRRHDVTR